MAGGILLCGAVFNLTAALVPLLVQTLIDQGRDYAFFCISIFAVLMIIQCAAGYGDMRLSWQFEKSIKTHIRRLFHFVLNTYPWVSNIRKPAQYISIFNNDIAQAEEYLELCVNTAPYCDCSGNVFYYSGQTCRAWIYGIAWCSFWGDFRLPVF